MHASVPISCSAGWQSTEVVDRRRRVPRRGELHRRWLAELAVLQPDDQMAFTCAQLRAKGARGVTPCPAPLSPGTTGS